MQAGGHFRVDAGEVGGDGESVVFPGFFVFVHPEVVAERCRGLGDFCGEFGGRCDGVCAEVCLGPDAFWFVDHGRHVFQFLF